MARITSSLSFNQDNLDLNRVYYNAFDAYLDDNSYNSFNGVTYTDSYIVDWYYGGTTYASVFAGSTITVDGLQNVTGGTVNGYLELYYNGVDYVPYLAIEGISLSALAMYQAAQTYDTADEYALINTALAGADTFSLSNYADKASGLGGNDTMYGYGGADLLNGGSGNDKLYGGAGRDTLISQTGYDQFVFNRTSETGALASSADVIRDFTKGYDKIVLSAIDAFAATTGVNDAFIFRGTAGFSSASAGEIRYERFDLAGTTSDYTMVYIDTDGDTGVEAAIKLSGLYTLAGTDFIL